MSEQDSDDNLREWSEAERLQLMALCDVGVPFNFVVRALSREPEDVLTQVWKMGLHINPAEKQT